MVTTAIYLNIQLHMNVKTKKYFVIYWEFYRTWHIMQESASLSEHPASSRLKFVEDDK